MDAEDIQILKKRLKKTQAAQADGKWYTPVPDKLLDKKKWSVQEALLIFAGLNPLVRDDIAWESNGFPVRLGRVERIGREINDPSTYSMMSRKELETEINKIRCDAIKKRNEACGQDLNAIISSINSWKDNDADRECKKWRRYYEETEDLLAYFLEKWQESRDEEISERLPPQTFIGWASDQGLTDKIPWWLEFVETGLIERYLDTKNEHIEVIAPQVVASKSDKETIYEGWDEICPAFCPPLKKIPSRGWVKTWMREADEKFISPTRKKKRIALSITQVRHIIDVYNNREKKVKKSF